MTTETAIRALVVVGVLYIAALFLSDIITDIRDGIRANNRRGPNKLS